MAAALVVLAMPISPTHSASGGVAVTASSPAFRAATTSLSVMAGPCVKSAVGRSSSSTVTDSSAPTERQSWFTAAPPAWKFATICAVTEAGKAETPRAATP